MIRIVASLFRYAGALVTIVLHRLPDGPRQANLVLITYANSEGSGEPAHPRSFARTSAARLLKQ